MYMYLTMEHIERDKCMVQWGKKKKQQQQQLQTRSIAWTVHQVSQGQHRVQQVQVTSAQSAIKLTNTWPELQNGIVPNN
jgi:hypothetical protein